MMEMRIIVLIALISLFFGCSIPEKKELDNTLYAFNNSMRMPNAPVGMDAQAGLIKTLGFDGFSGHTNDDYFARRAALDKAGLKMPEIYWGIDMDSTGQVSYKEGLKEIIQDSKDRDLLVALFSNAKYFADKKEQGDILLSKGLGELADFASGYGVRIAIYPHVSNYCETLEHSIHVAKMTNRPNVGAIFNTCHLLKVEGEEGWEQKLIDAIPMLFMISINGADSGNTKEMNWDKLIQPLGEGTFDTYKLVKLAKDNGYIGPFGLQCYDIKQDCKAALTKSINTWKDYKKRYATEK
jgi:sugar phosphate isomerase/epimerase